MSTEFPVMDVTKPQSKRYVSLDFGRGLAIVVMLFLHIVQLTLDDKTLFENINDVPMLNLLALALIPFFGGLAGFFLLVSSASNMVSIYRNLQRGKTIRSLVFKQILGGFFLLIFGMLCEGLIGYHGLVGNFFQNLNNPTNTDWQIMLWRWNFFETIHTIAWCLIVNGCVQGLLSLKSNWKRTTRLIISYIVLAVIVVSLTQPIWNLVNLVGPGYPFDTFPSGHKLYTPWIGTESFWQIIRTPFLNVLSAPMEPLFPYLAVSFIGSIIGIILSKPKEEISKKFPRNTFFGALIMFVSGIIGIVIIVMQIMSASYISADSFDVAATFYMQIINHRAWAPDNSAFIYSGEIVPIPPFAWLAQFLAVNGFSLMCVMLLFRLIEFRGKSKIFADKSRFVRRFGIIAFTNYNNQWLFYIVYLVVSLIFYQVPYKELLWGGVFLVIIFTYLIYSLILWGWEKIGYIGSLEWFIRTLTNNIVPVRRETFDKGTKWWEKGKIDVENIFYNALWIDIVNSEDIDVDELKKKNNSKFAFALSLIGLGSILFILLTIISLAISVTAMKTEGKNKCNIAAAIISIIGIVVIITFIITTLIIPIGALGLF